MIGPSPALGKIIVFGLYNKIWLSRCDKTTKNITTGLEIRRVLRKFRILQTGFLVPGEGPFLVRVVRVTGNEMSSRHDVRAFLNLLQ